MGYAAARGGLDAISAAEALVRDARDLANSPWLELDQLIDRQRLAVDRVMGEGGLWDPRLAARALQQSEGDTIEASHLLRSYRATMPRFAYSHPVDMDDARVLRRIVPAFRNPPGPQLLGRTTDYTGRLLDRTDDALARERAEKRSIDWAPAEQAVTTSNPTDAGTVASTGPTKAHLGDRRHRRLLDVLRDMDLMVDRRRTDDPEPADITRAATRPPAPRPAVLATMARAETGALVNLWYRNILGPDGYIHEVTLGEVRHAEIPVTVTHPHTGGPVDIGGVRVTEVEAIEDLDGADEDRTRFDAGYGLCFGHNEKKAIAMANLDIACHRDGGGVGGASDLEQSILMTTDGLDASGFLEHLKLPHYVTFRSMIDRKMAMRSARTAEHPVFDTTTATDAPVPVDPREGDCA
ncbi:carbon-phosphorus lyase complex subunit PhnI [Ilumatobacter sp.]|uniref:carbon-phosphorus lyase complex subunit PhnI n=2 Tax=Ilumatobacter sp. TaxID=1967498 RepID=UPI003753A752